MCIPSTTTPTASREFSAACALCASSEKYNSERLRDPQRRRDCRQRTPAARTTNQFTEMSSSRGQRIGSLGRRLVSDHGDRDPRCPRLFQGPRRLAGRRPGRQHVVDQDDVRSRQVRVAGDGERPANVDPSLPRLQVRLPRRRANAAKRPNVDRNAEGPCQRSCESFAGIESSPRQPRPVQGNRNSNSRAKTVELPRQDVREDRRQRRRHGFAPRRFAGQNDSPMTIVVRPDSDDAVERERLSQATRAHAGGSRFLGQVAGAAWTNVRRVDRQRPQTVRAQGRGPVDSLLAPPANRRQQKIEHPAPENRQSLPHAFIPNV